ncbi:MAG: glycoside hydrolase family 97 catalytic domain-containing protein, partial [Muribaculaceae bacterium]|nr:glycoside hydrolase family 97 catalytic domain-containing protein [Muribaculaceae bacterium]
MNPNGNNSEKYYGNFLLTESLGDNVTNRKVYGSPESTIVRLSNGQSKPLIVATATTKVENYALPDVAGSYMLSIDLAAGTISVDNSYTPDVMYLLRNMSDGIPQDISVQLNRVGTSQQYSGSELPMKFEASGASQKCYYFVSAANGNQWSVINAERYGLASSMQLENGTTKLTSGAEMPLFTQKEGTFDVSFNRQTKELSIKPTHPDLYLVGAVNGMTWDQRGSGEKIKYVESEKCYYATFVPNAHPNGVSFSFISRSNGNISESDNHRYAGFASNQPITVGSNVLCRADVYNVISSYALPANYSCVPLYARISLDDQTMLLQTTPFANSDAPKVNPTNEVWSPNGKVGLVSTIENGKPYYKVISNNEWVINKSPLGLVSDAVDYTQYLSIIGAETREINETYTLPTGKKSTYVNNANELTIHLQTVAGQPFDIVFRVSNDGVAFRYVIPSQDGKSSIIIKDEASAVYPANYKYLLGQKFASKRNTPNFPYESYYGKYGVYGEYTDWNEAVTDASDPRFNSPVMIGSGSQHILMSEAENIGTYSLSLLKAYSSPTGCMMWQHAGDSYQTHKVDGKNNLTVKLPLQTPWRTLQIGDLPTIFASTMQENLCKPTEMTDLSWIEPGVASWDWGGVDGVTYAPLTRYEADEKYADMAAKMGWKYILIDGGWSEYDIQNTINYAHSKGIKVILWMTARLSESTSFSFENMESTLRTWKQWGVEGVKIDFWEDDSRETMERMELLLKLTAKYKMNVNFHGCTRPSGLRRTYPHLFSYEGILGGENNFWADAKYMTAQHNINSILTRNVVGTADF